MVWLLACAPVSSPRPVYLGSQLYAVRPGLVRSYRKQTSLVKGSVHKDRRTVYEGERLPWEVKLSLVFRLKLNEGAVELLSAGVMHKVPLGNALKGLPKPEHS